MFSATVTSRTTLSPGVPESKDETAVGTPMATTQVHVFMKFSFSMESLVVALFSGDTPVSNLDCVE